MSPIFTLQLLILLENFQAECSLEITNGQADTMSAWLSMRMDFKGDGVRLSRDTKVRLWVL